MPSLPRIIQCGDVLEYLKHLDQFARRGWIFRGHSSRRCLRCGAADERRLESTLQRFLRRNKALIEQSSWTAREREIVRRFRNAAPLQLHHLPQDDLDWLALIRHYGGPTRLLDFTFNPTVALYFALDSWDAGTAEVSIHALHLDSIRKRTADVLQLPACPDGSIPNPPGAWYRIGERPMDTDFVGVFDGELPSERQHAQEGVFLVPSRIDLDFEQWLIQLGPDPAPEPHGVHWIKFDFHVEEAKLRLMIKQLMNLGMSPERLFPGLEGLCRNFEYAWLDVVKDLSPSDEPSVPK